MKVLNSEHFACVKNESVTSDAIICNATSEQEQVA